MKKKYTYKEVQDANYIMEMMKEDVFGHRVTSWNPKDTAKLKGKLYQPLTDKEKEDYVTVVEPLMLRKTFIAPGKDRYLDAFLDLDTRISQQNLEPDEDRESERLDKILGSNLT